MRVGKLKRKQVNIFIETAQILKSEHPTHSERVWLAGYLLWANNNNVDKVCKVIHDTNQWDDYDEKITRIQVESVLRSKRSGTREYSFISSSISQALTEADVDKLAEKFDWDKAQQEAFAETEKMRRCVEKDCYLELECSMKPCWKRGG